MVNSSIVNALGCGLVLLLLSACGSTPIKQIQVSIKSIEKPALILPKTDTLDMKKVEWFVITPENFEAQIKKLKKSGRPIALFALTDTGYANLGLNLSGIRSLVQQQQTIILAYESYYKNAEKALEDANKQISGVKKTVDEANKANSKPEKSFIDKINPFK